jgi:hypothetical protein
MTVSGSRRMATVAKPEHRLAGNDDQIVLTRHVIPVPQRTQMDRTVDLDREPIEVGIEPSAAARSVKAKLLSAWRRQTCAARKPADVDLGERPGTALDVAQDVGEQGMVARTASRE